MFLGRTNDYQFYSAEIDHCPEAKLKRIADACKAVEDEVWKASSNFYDYIKKQSAVLYAKKNDRVVGFALFELYVDGDTLVVAANECMVLKENQGDGLPSIFTALLVKHIQRDNKLRGIKRSYSSMSFVALTVNYKLMLGFQRYSLLTEKSSFEPDDQIRQVADHYSKKEKLEFLTNASPFFVKAAFPNSVIMVPKVKKPDFVPEEFQPTRGDSFLFVCRISKFLILGLAARFVLFRYRFRFSKRILPISRISRPHIIYSRKKEDS